MSRLRGAIRSGVARVTGTGGGASMVLAVLALACVFIAVAGPRQSLRFRTVALHQALAAAPVLARSMVADVDYPSLASAIGATDSSGGNQVDIPVTSLRPMGGSIAQSLIAGHIPLRPVATRWLGMDAGYIAFPGAAKHAWEAGFPPQFALLYRDPLAAHVKVLAGHLPESATIRRGVPVLQIAVTPATAARFGLSLGTIKPYGMVKVRVTAIIKPIGRSDFWPATSNGVAPELVKSAGAYVYTGAGFVGAGGLGTVEQYFDINQMRFEWDFPIALSTVDANHAPALLHNLNAALTAAGQIKVNVVTTQQALMSCGLINVLDAFVRQDAQIGSVMSLLYISLSLICAVVLLLGTRLLAERRSAEYSLMRARGSSAAQIAMLAVRATALVVLPAGAVSALLATISTPGINEPLAWWLAGSTIAAALVGAAVFGVRLSSSAQAGNPREDAPVTGIARTRRWVADVTLVLIAITGLALLRQQSSTTTGGVDYYTSAAPALVAVPLAILVIRALPTLTRWLARLAGRRSGVTSFVGFARAARTSAGAVLAAFALVLALALVGFGATLHRAVAAAQQAASWQATGADAIINASAASVPVTPRIEHAVGAVPGVERWAAVATLAGQVTGGGQINISVINPAQYEAFLRDTPDRQLTGAALGRTSPGSPVPVIASAGGGSMLSRNATVVVGPLTVRVRVVGAIGATPAAPNAGPVILVPAWAAPSFGNPPANLMVIAGPALDAQRLTALVAGMAPGTTISLRSAYLASLTEAPLPHGAYVSFLLAALGAALLSAAILLVILLLGARSRDLALSRLFTMGLSAGQSRRLVFIEGLPAVLAAVLGGVASVLILVQLIGPAVDLSAFTGSPTGTKVTIDLSVLGFAALSLLLLALATLFVQTALTRARGVTRALRVGE